MNPKQAQSVLKVLLFNICLLPLAWLGYKISINALGADPGKEVVHFLGEWAFYLLLASLAITPLRRITGINKLIRYRRMVGLFALFYAALHFVGYLFFLLGWQFADLIDDVVKRPYITVGFAAFFILVVLGATSTQRMMRLLGKNWQKLHRLVYLAALLSLVHLIWLTKSDYTSAAYYGGVFALLMLARVKK
ncbi:protein-methionine-sulfoxide reductase heme-binding subunit MsrQ [Spongorhabdus nitratireducens]